MIKRLERSLEGSCWNKATEDDLVFVLIQKDPAASVAIKAWIAERIRINKNHINDLQIVEAFNVAIRMEEHIDLLRQREYDETERKEVNNAVNKGEDPSKD